MNYSNEQAKKWELINRNTIHESNYCSLHLDRYQLPNGLEIVDFAVIDEHPGVNIIALTADKRVLVVKQYRPPTDSFVFDFPGGRLESETDIPLERAKKELEEETGYKSTTWIELGFFFPSPHRSTHKVYSFLATNIKKNGEQDLDPTEDLEWFLIDIHELEQMIINSIFSCGICSVSFLRAYLYLTTR